MTILHGAGVLSHRRPLAAAADGRARRVAPGFGAGARARRFLYGPNCRLFSCWRSEREALRLEIRIPLQVFPIPGDERGEVLEGNTSVVHLSDRSNRYEL